MTLRAAVFLDRDGVIIENRSDYVKCWQEVCFLPEAIEALRRLSRTEYALVLITNQSVVGRGIISPAQAIKINSRLVAEIRAQGGRMDAVYLCPHRPDGGCNCRKPAPGMFFRAAAELGLDLARSYAIGDAESDVIAARAAGVRGILVLTGRGMEQVTLLRSQKAECVVVPDLGTAVDYIVAQRQESS